MKRFFSNRILSIVSMCACALALSTKPLYAIQDGDIVTISQKEGDTYNYLTLWTNNLQYNFYYLYYGIGNYMSKGSIPSTG